MSDARHPSRAISSGLTIASAARGLAILSILIIAFATLKPSVQTVSSSRWCVVCGELGGVDVVLNVLLFVPLGLALGVMHRGPAWRAVAGMAAFSLAIETMQHWIPGRDASVGDLITNSSGGALGYALGAHMLVLVAPAPAVAARLVATWCCVWVLGQCIASMSLIPLPTHRAYWGQIRPSLGGRDPFGGLVFLTGVDRIPIPAGRLGNSDDIRAGLARPAGAIIDVVVRPGRPPSRLSPIFRIADDQEHEILMVAQRARDAIVTVRTASASFRLRPQLYLLPNVFAREPSPGARYVDDTIHVSAVFSRGAVTLHRGSLRDGMADARIRMTPADGWRLVFPAQTFTDDSLATECARLAWVFVLFAPAGYWLAYAWRPRGRVRSAQRALAVGAPALLVPVGLIGIPLAFGFGAPRWPEFCGAGAGAVCGYAVMHALRRMLARSGGGDRGSAGQ